MNYKFSIVLIYLLFLASCSEKHDGVLVRNVSDFNEAVKNAVPGDKILLANGVWQNAELQFFAEGEEGKPIILSAQQKGKVSLEGQSNLRIAGNYLRVEGLVFKNGYTPTSEVISFRKNKEILANHCRVTECVIDNYNPPERFDSDYWVGIYGKNNRFDHNYLVGKRNQGVTLAVRLNTEESRENNHRIDHNYFGYHQILGSNGGETLRIGTSHHSLTNSKTLVENNYFERCNGEHEIISNKSCQNTFRNNTFYECQGTLTMRHGNETLVENNFFFGNGKSNTGGIRIINETQTVKNNYLEGLTGYRFRGALVIMNGVPNSPPNRYFQVINSEASNNTFVNCDYIQLCAGSDEERSAVPVNTVMKDNIIYHETKKDVFTVYDDISGIEFKGNVLSPGIEFPKNKGRTLRSGFESFDLVPVKGKNGLISFSQVPEKGFHVVGEIASAENTGVSWYPKKDYRIHFDTGSLLEISAGENSLFEAVRNSKEGDIIELSEEGQYNLTKAIDINHTITVRAKKGLEEKPLITFERRSLFNIENGGSLKLEGLVISGKNADDMSGNTVIRTSRYSMINNYKLFMENCDFTDLDVNHSFNVLKVYKNTFADSIVMKNCSVNNITGHVMSLDKETDDIGIYNVENVYIDSCEFNAIGGVVLHLYRGGRDESTFGPILQFFNSSLKAVGYDKRNKHGSSIKLHGVQYADLEGLQLEDSREIKLHLIVGEPVIKLHDLKFKGTKGYSTNDNAIQTSKLSYN
jgi:poly(beta-D-mannuronate) lyase